jgi:hypothetical protein
VFLSHWHNFWVERGIAPWPTAATFNHQSDLNNITADVEQSFPKGVAFADWLVNVRASTTKGKLPLTAAQHTIDRVNGQVAQRWIHSTSPNSVQYLTFNTPMNVPVANQCGRIVLTDIHVSSGDVSSTSRPFPTGCTTQDLTPQEKALLFMLFDLSSCVQDDKTAPTAPPPIPR